MLWLTSSKFQPQEPFHLFPPPSLFVTLIYFWHCTLVFSKGKTVGNLKISGPIHPFFSITSSPVIDVTVAAPWCKWLISICFHPRGLTQTIRGPQDSAAATTKYVFVVRPVFKNVIKSTSLHSGLPDEVKSCHLSVKLEKPACIMGQYSTSQQDCLKRTGHVFTAHTLSKVSTHTHYIRVHTQICAQKLSCQSDLKTVDCQRNGSQHPKGWTAE